MNSQVFVDRDLGPFRTKQNAAFGNINMSPIFGKYGKRMTDFRKTAKFKRLVEECSKKFNAHANKLVVLKEGGISNMQGTWLHPYLIYHLIENDQFPWMQLEDRETIKKWGKEWVDGKLKAAQKEYIFPGTPLPIRLANDGTPEKEIVDKADAYDSLAACPGWFSLNAMAKMIGVSNLGQNNLRKWLTDNGYVYLDIGKRVAPYQNYVAIGWMKTFAGKYTVEKKAQQVAYAVTRYSLKGIRGILKALKADGKVPRDTKLDPAAGNEEAGGSVGSLE